MKEVKIEKSIVYSLFDEDGNLVDEDKREDITDTCTFWPDDVVKSSLTVSRGVSIMTYKYGGNSTAFMSVKVPYTVAPGEFEKAQRYGIKQCENHAKDALTGYKSFLDAQGIDWNKVEEQMKKR